MTDRDRLIELIKQSSQYICEQNSLIEKIADYLLANGVIVIPCKVGTEVYLSDYINTHHRVKEYKFLGNKIAVVIECWEWQRTCTRMLDEFGKSIFLTKEEAEKKLKELNEK
jgi:hypothetical protein